MFNLWKKSEKSDLYKEAVLASEELNRKRKIQYKNNYDSAIQAITFKLKSEGSAMYSSRSIGRYGLEEIGQHFKGIGFDYYVCEDWNYWWVIHVHT